MRCSRPWLRPYDKEAQGDPSANLDAPACVRRRCWHRYAEGGAHGTEDVASRSRLSC